MATLIRFVQIGLNIRVPRNLLVLMRTAFLMESTVRLLDPDFNLIDGVLGRAAAALTQGANTSAAADLSERLKYETLTVFQNMPQALGRLVHAARKSALGIRLQHQGLEDLERHLDRSSKGQGISGID